jgi:transcriptional regulator with XRE-family HTH domain
MTGGSDPAVQRRRLRVSLRAIRQGKSLTQKQVATDLDWSPSKLLRIENGMVSISRSDLMALLSYYEITDRQRIDELVAIAQDAKKQPWSQYRDIFTPEFLTFLGYESSAEKIRQFEPLLIPGLLQTEEYARETIRAFTPREDSEETLDRRVQARTERQELLSRDGAPHMHFIIDEAALQRRIGKGGVMIRQLERLIELSKSENVTIQMVPFTVGAYPGLRGPFVILDFEDPDFEDMLYVENFRGDFVSAAGGDDVALAAETFFLLEDLATPKSRFTEVAEKIINEMRKAAESIKE